MLPKIWLLLPVIEHDKDTRTTTITWQHCVGFHKFDPRKSGYGFVFDWVLYLGFIALYMPLTRKESEARIDKLTKEEEESEARIAKLVKEEEEIPPC